MKGYTAASAPPAKRRWKGLAVAVLALVFFSLLVPLAFLLGLHNRFPSGYLTDDRSPSETSFESFDRVEGVQLLSEGDQSRIDNLIEKFGPILSKDVDENSTRQADWNLQKKTENEFTAIGVPVTSQPKDTASHSEPKDDYSQFKVLPIAQVAATKSLSAPNARNGNIDAKKNHLTGSADDEAKRSCQLEFGSYCLWSIEHKEVMEDSVVKRLKDQLFVARGYYPSIAKLQSQEQLSRELKQNIQEHEHMLSEAILDADLPPLVIKTIQKMDETIERAKACTIDCNNVDKKLRQILDLTEDEAHFHMKQSAYLYHLGVQTIPKSLHCLSMRLTLEYFKSSSVDTDSHAHTLNNPGFRHYVILSRNVLAATVAINSTVVNSEETGNMVFHLLTDEQNYYAMKLWFARKSYKEAAIHVLNFDELYTNHRYKLGLTQLAPSEEFRVSIRDIGHSSPAQMRTEYISVFGHSHFLLPEIFKNLKKVVILDDDVVVQRDLSSLWNLDLEGKVNGAVEFCGLRLNQMKTYWGRNNYDVNSCAWMSGLNVVDLEKWREHNITGIYQQLLQKLQNTSEGSRKAASLRTSLFAFQNQIYPLDASWALSGLGHSYGISADFIKDAAVLHYNGNMKPWLELGIPKYKGHWKKFLTRDERFMDECNVNP